MLWQIFIIYSSGMRHVMHGLLLIAGVCLPLMFGTYFLVRSIETPSDRHRAVHAALLTLFVFYCVVLVGALILSRVDYLNFAQTHAEYRSNFESMTNFRPFETVQLYINAIRYNYIGMEIPLSNLVGNALLFMPMAVFLPCLFRPMKKLWVFALTMLLMLVAVEAVQLWLACGSCDVDDVLLNLAGTLILFGILKIPVIQRLMRRMYLLPGEAASKSTQAAQESAPPATE
ncbi:MAG: VanZ family protein [Christensenella sp.]|nr:VanZ family protein [Christensenella sp.]